MSPRSIKFVLAACLACVGVVVAGRALWRSWPQTVREAEQRIQAEELPLAAELRADLAAATPPATSEALQDLRLSLEREILVGIASLPLHQQPAGARAATLARDAAQGFWIYLSADFSAYREYLTARGANDEGTESFFQATTAPYRAQPVLPGQVLVYPVIFRGREVSQADLGSESIVTKEGRYGLPVEPGPSMTVYNIALPVRHVFRDKETPVHLGLWMTWSERQSRWVVWRTVVYDPTRSATIIPPPLL
mgnify:CR=1 FL=1|jgi:hypothetical protein